MIQLRPQISLKIDSISKDGICLRLFGWLLFYLILHIMMINNKKKYVYQTIPLDFFEQQFTSESDDVSDNPLDNKNYTNATGKYQLMVQNISEVQININITILKDEFYDLEQVVIKEDQILNDMQYTLIVRSETQEVILNKSHTTSLKCKINKQIDCTGYLETILNNGYKELQFQLLIIHHNAAAIHNQTFLLLYENSQYYTMIIIFQVFFSLLILYGIYYFFSNLSDYPKQLWPKINQWLAYLLIGMLFYNFPILLFRNRFSLLIHYYSNIVELSIQSGLFYFWLSIFELEQSENTNKYSVWNILKILLVILYTVPQAIMDTFIFVMQEEILQYDPRLEIPFYSLYLKFVLLSLISYSVCFVFLLYKSFNKEQQLLITEPPPQQDADFDGLEIEGQNSNTEIRNYKLLHILSTICFSFLVYYQMVSILDPTILTTSSTINEWSLINIYLCIVTQLYMPYSQPYEDEPHKQMYGNIEMDDFKVKRGSSKLANKKFYTKQKDADDIQI